MNHRFRRDGLALLLVITVLCAPLLALGLYVSEGHRRAEQKLADLEPRYARLAGLAASRAALDTADAAARALLAKYAYPASEDLTQAGNDAQQRVRDIFTAAGLQVVSSQVLPAKDEKLFDRVPLTVRLEGELSGVQDALVALSGQTPAILIDSLGFHNNGGARPDAAPRLGTQFNLSVLRIKR